MRLIKLPVIRTSIGRQLVANMAEVLELDVGQPDCHKRWQSDAAA